MMVFPQATSLETVMPCLEHLSDGCSGVATLSEHILGPHLFAQIDIRSRRADALHSFPLPAHVVRPNFSFWTTCQNRHGTTPPRFFQCQRPINLN